jgi:hypothetical protein
MAKSCKEEEDRAHCLAAAAAVVIASPCPNPQHLIVLDTPLHLQPIVACYVRVVLQYDLLRLGTNSNGDGTEEDARRRIFWVHQLPLE